MSQTDALFISINYVRVSQNKNRNTLVFGVFPLSRGLFHLWLIY